MRISSLNFKGLVDSQIMRIVSDIAGQAGKLAAKPSLPTCEAGVPDAGFKEVGNCRVGCGQVHDRVPFWVRLHDVLTIRFI